MRRSVLVFLRHNLLAGTMPRGKNFALQRSVKICFCTAGNGFVPLLVYFLAKRTPAAGCLFFVIMGKLIRRAEVAFQTGRAER
jgi:hypothetical protein